MNATTVEDVATVEGLVVELASALAFRAGITHRATCTTHEYCRNRPGGVVFNAQSWEDLHLRVIPGFFAHCEEMERMGEK
ncbi:hypothetical protein ACIF6L_26380 [Kitasatospora sp. NPDC086009]|uniref:hypothetical protein n=1 Tax=unclassified Kitasatospora TaxID=2633591 RepID=UPI0037C98926